MDWFAVVGLWVATAVLAVKTGDLPLMRGAPIFFAAHWWGYVPFALVTASGIWMAVRSFRGPGNSHAARVLPPEYLPQPLPPEARFQLILYAMLGGGFLLLILIAVWFGNQRASTPTPSAPVSAASVP